MVIHIVGRLGSGKTLYAVEKIVEALVYTDKEIYTNIRLNDFWDFSLSQDKSKGLLSFIKFLLSPSETLKSYRLRLAEGFSKRYKYFSSLENAVEACFFLGESTESSRLFVWDEIHLDLNSRMWKKTSGSMIQFFAMSRKLGFDILMISQLKGAVDRQMRDLADICFELKNMSHIRPFGLRIFPSVGLLVKRWSNSSQAESKGMIVGVGVIRFSSFVASLYNTKQLLTETTETPPILWVSKQKKASCDECAYKKYYITYSSFVAEYLPDEFNTNKMPAAERLIYKTFNDLFYFSGI
jgi:hypothetical protein